MGVFGLDLWCCPSSVGYLWCSWLGFGLGLLLGRVWFRGRPACPPPFPVPARGVGVCAGSQSRLLGSNPIVWLCGQEPVKSCQKGPPPEKAKLKRWWTYLSQFRLTVHHIPGIKNELSDYISRNNFDALIAESSEALARKTFQRMDVQLDLSMRTAGILEGWSPTDYQSEYKEIFQNPQHWSQIPCH